MSSRKLEISQHFRTQDFISKSQLTKIEWKTISRSLLKLMSIESVIPSNHLILCHPPLLLPSIFPSIWVFSNESALCIRQPKYWSFSFSINPSNEYSGLISFRMDGLISLQSKGLSRVFSNTTVQKYGLPLTSIHDYRKNHSFNYTDICWQSNVSAVQVGHSLFSKEQASFNFMAAVTICSNFGAQENKVCHCFHCFLIYLPLSDRTGCHDLRFLNVEF